MSRLRRAMTSLSMRAMRTLPVPRQAKLMPRRLAGDTSAGVLTTSAAEGIRASVLHHLHEPTPGSHARSAMNHTDLENQAERAARDERFGARRARRPGESRRRFEMERLREVGKNLGGQIDEQVRKRPYVAVGAALGAGFVAGS